MCRPTAICSTSSCRDWASQTRTAASAEEAIAAHDEWHPDLVLMDLRMPGMGGLEASAGCGRRVEGR